MHSFRSWCFSLDQYIPVLSQTKLKFSSSGCMKETCWDFPWTAFNLRIHLEILDVFIVLSLSPCCLQYSIALWPFEQLQSESVASRLNVSEDKISAVWMQDCVLGFILSKIFANQLFRWHQSGEHCQRWYNENSEWSQQSISMTKAKAKFNKYMCWAQQQTLENIQL